MDFSTSNDNNTLFKTITINGKKVNILIDLNKSDISNIENINWDVVSKVSALIGDNIDEHINKSIVFIQFLIQNSDLYTLEEMDKIKDFQLISIEIIRPFGKYSYLECTKYILTFDFVSNYWIDTYGLINVTFMNKCVIGVERIQN